MEKDGKIIGMIGFAPLNWKHGFAEFGYFLSQNEVGKGYISTAVKALEKVLFDIGFERLVIGADTENVPSQKVAIRNGYRHEGTKWSGYYSVYMQSYKDIMIFSKIKSEL